MHYLQSRFRQLQTSPPGVWGRFSSDLRKFLPDQLPDNITCLHLFIIHRDKHLNCACYSIFSVVWLCTGQTQHRHWAEKKFSSFFHSGWTQLMLCAPSLLRALCNRFFLIFRACASPEEITGLIISLGEKLTIFFVEEERESRAVG